MIDKIIKHFGSQDALARCLFVDKSAISQWKLAGIPPARAIEIERITFGKFKAVDIVASKTGGNDE